MVCVAFAGMTGIEHQDRMRVSGFYAKDGKARFQNCTLVHTHIRVDCNPPLTFVASGDFF